MSSEEGDSGPGTREVARRLFAAEFDDADFSYSESDEERAPNYVVAPTGERVNRLFAVGVLTEVAQAGDSILRARVADPTGAFVVYAGQYQPEAMAFLDRTEPPAFVALTGKARTFQPDDADVTYTSVRPEEMNVVDRETRDRWAVTTAERTLHRVAVAGAAVDSGLEGEELRAALVEAGVDESLAAGVPLALERYGTTPAYLSALQDLALDAARLVAGDIDEVGSLSLSPGEGDGTFAPAVDPGIELPTATAAGASSGAAGASTASSETDPSFEPVEEAESATEASVGTPEETAAGDEDVAEPEEPVEAEVGDTADEPADTGLGDTEPAGTAEAAEPGGAEDEPAEPEIEEPEDVEFDPDEEVLDDEERQAVEEEYGLEFESGTEVDSPDSEPEPEPETEPEFEPVDPEEESAEPEEPQFEPTGEATDDEGEEEAPAEPEPEPEPEPESTPDDESDAEPEPDEEPADDRPLGDVLIEHMEELDDGTGAPRDELVAAVTEATGADEAAVDEAIEDALMSGRCYEPDDDRYASI